MSFCLFFPLENNLAIGARWISSLSFTDYHAFVNQDIDIYRRLLKNAMATQFRARQFPYGLPIGMNAFEIFVAVNQRESGPDSIFIDSLDVDDGYTIGNSGYGVYPSLVSEHSVRIHYQADTKVLLQCEFYDSNRHKETLTYYIDFQDFIESVEVLASKTDA